MTIVGYCVFISEKEPPSTRIDECKSEYKFASKVESVRKGVRFTEVKVVW